MRQYRIHNEKNPSQFADHPFIDYNSHLEQIDVKEFTWNQLINMFKSDVFPKNHSIEEILR